MASYSGCFLVGITYTSDDGCLTRWFVYVSGEKLELAKAEVDVLSRLLSSDIRLDWIGRLALIGGAANVSEFILDRAALTLRAGEVLYESDSVNHLTREESVDVLKKLMKPSDTFSIKTLCVDVSKELERRVQIERDLGAHIKAITGATVNLRNPAKQILVILTDEKILVCKSNESKLRINLRNREPSKKLFFHPSMMNSSLARVMCNLAGIRLGDIVLDPFCGGGGILCEASYLGAAVVGLDLNWKLLTGAKRNLKEISQNFCIIQADARNIPISSVDCIVTDPPYGRSSSTRGAHSIELVEMLLERVDSIVQSKGERVCICGDIEMDLPQLVQDSGLHVERDFKIRVHSGLVREIVTIRR